MRGLLLGLIVVAAMAAPAAAQYGTTPYQSGFTNATTAIGALPPDGREWVLAETARQAAAPTGIAEIDKGLEEAVGDAAPGAAKALRAKPTDVMSALRFEIVREARRMVDRELRERKKEAKAGQSDDVMLGLQALEGRRIRLGAMESQATRRLTAKGREIIAD